MSNPILLLVEKSQWLKTLENKLSHPELANLLQKAFPGEKAAAYAYQGHAASVKNPLEKMAIR